jgi:hypothetical protein
VVVLNTFDPSLSNLSQLPKKTRQSIEQVTIESPVPEGLKLQNYLVYCSYKNIPIKIILNQQMQHQEVLKTIVRFMNPSKLF